MEQLVHRHQILIRADLATQLQQQESHELPRRALRLKHERRARLGPELLQQLKQQVRLPHARLGNQRHEPALRVDAVKQ